MLLRFITSVLLAGVLVACGQGVEDSKDKINHPPTVLGVKIKTPSDAPAILGDVLKAEYQYRDLDGDAEGNSRYQWLRDDIPIPDARSIDYEITEQDINQKISFRVTPFAVSGESQGAAAESLHLLVGNDSPSAKSIQIFLNDMPVDSVKVGQVLTASYEYADLEGDAEDASAVTYQWYRNDEAIPNATDKNYQVVLVDLGKNLSVSVKPIAAEGTEEGKISMGLTQLTVINSAPVAKNLQLTSSTGNKQTVVVGTILSANFQFYDVDGDSQAGALVQWYRGDEAIPGDEARQANYKVVTQDSGKHLSFSIIPLAQMGEEIGVAVQSESVLVNNSPPSVVFNSIALSSSGGDLAKVHVGDALTVSFEFSDPDADEEGSHQYQWYKGVAAIADATSSSYLVKTEDNTQSLSVKITPKQADGVSGAVQQSASVAIVNRAPSLEALPSLVNSTSSDLAATYVGHTLTASYQGSFVDPDGDTEGESVTVWLRDGLEINNATGTSYTLKKADSGKAIAFYVKQLKDTHEGVATVGYASAEVLVKNSAPTVSDISILGTAAVSNTLTATVTIDDVDGDTAGAHLYQWKRDGANVGTQTTVNTYVLGLGDAGKNISVEVEPVDSRGNRGVGVVSTAKAVSNLSLDFNLAITTGHLKQLNLNWNSISGSNYYNVLINPDGASGFEKLAENVTDTNYLWEVSVHLTDWANASIAVEACDGSGCYVSPASTIAEFMVESIGYVKASLPQIYANFSIVSLSADGKTMAVGAPKDSIGEGITHYDGVIPSVNLAYSGGVYIYNKKPNGEWYYFAQIKGTNLSEDDYFGAPLALSADGKWLVVGAPFEDGSGSGVLNSPSDWPTDDLKSAAGAVYIFALGSNNRWEQKAYLKASNSGYDDRFGTSVSISSNGDMVVVGAIGEGSDTTGVVHKGSPWPADDNAGFSGAVYVFERDNLNNWSQQAFVKASNNKAGSDFGISVSLSGDGNALAVGSAREDGSFRGVTQDSSNWPANSGNLDSGAVYLFKRSAQGLWHQEAYIKPENQISTKFGYDIELSQGGNLLVVGANYESGSYTGVFNKGDGAWPSGMEDNVLSYKSGAAYIFEVDSLGVWSHTAYVKRKNMSQNASFGASIAISSGNDLIAIGSPGDPWEFSGTISTNDIDSYPKTSSSYGAVYLLKRDLSGKWSHYKTSKASSLGGVYFGSVVHFSQNGNTMAVGAHGESGAGTGVYNTYPGPTDTSVSQSGAVYLY